MSRANRKIINRLRKHRKIMGYTQEEVAWFLEHKSVSRIVKWERGTAMPNVKNLLKLSFLYRTLANQLYYDLSQELATALHEKEKKITEDVEPLANSP